MESLPNNNFYITTVDYFKAFYQTEIERITLELGCDIITPVTFQEDFQKLIDVVDGTIPEYEFWEWVDQTNDEISIDLNRNAILDRIFHMVIETIISFIPGINKIERYKIPGIVLDFDENYFYILDIRSNVNVPYPIYRKARSRLY